MKPIILAIVGPTASGKTALSIKLAKALDGEIVSADSRQVYRGLDLASGKVTRREMRGVPHHMLDVCSLKRTYTVADYQKQAYKVIDDILKRDKLPIIVGGSGQYVDAIIKGVIVPEVPPNIALRRKLNPISLKLHGASKLFKIIKRLDPERAKQIDANNPRRLVRAIEIATALGKVPKLVAKPRYEPIVIGIQPRIYDLRFKIHERIQRRVRAGMINEIKKLHKSGVSWKRLQSLGLECTDISAYLQGKLNKQEMLTQLETHIIQYSKRQMTWWKRDKDIVWHNGDEKLI